MTIKEGLQLGLGHRSFVAGQFHAIAEEDQQRQAGDPEAVAGGGIGVSLELAHRQTALVLGGGPVHQRGHQTTGAAPRCPEIDKNDLAL